MAHYYDLLVGQVGKQNFGVWPRDFHFPMAGWDEAHDLGSKQLLGGTVTPSRTASAGRTGTATLADVNAAVDNLFNHPNVGPFLGRLLIQRLVTSNPSPAYIGRVSAAFADNGQGVRGDMKAVVRAILLDPDVLLRRLDLVLTGGTLAPANFQTIGEALVRIGPGSSWDWPKKRLKLAIYLIVTSPEFAVQR